jgi:uncharacterized protein (TIGR02391 family)
MNYEKRNFTNAILDAFYFLSDLLRKKSGAEGDGASLIGQALGGNSPKIKLNSLQSDSELSEQKGIEQLLRGFYQAVRNPRSHEKFNDTEEDAQVLIIFINYLVRKIDQAKAQFSRQDFLKRVLDPDFFPQARYAELLVNEIPIGQRLDVFLDVYRSKEQGTAVNLRLFFDALLKQLGSEERSKVHQILSEELRINEDEGITRIILGSFSGACAGDIWPFLDEAARLRTEHKIIRSIQDGRHDRNQKKCKGGALGTWAAHILKYFLLKQEVLRTLNSKLRSDSELQQDYVLNFFFDHLNQLADRMPEFIERTLKDQLKSGNKRFYDALIFDGPWEATTWTKELKEA